MALKSYKEVFDQIARKNKEYSKLDPEMEKIFRTQGLPKPFLPQPDNMSYYRKISAGTTKRFMKSAFVRSTLSSLPNLGFHTQDKKIPTQDGTEIDARIYHPSRIPSESYPVLVMAHGGGWCLGGLDTEAFISELICRSIGIIVVDVAYRLAPEVKYPVIVSDIYDALKWVAANAPAFGGDLKKGFIAAGVSGGGNLTTTTTYLARDNHLQPPLTGSLLMCTGMPHWSQNKSDGVLDLYPGKMVSWYEHKDLPITGHQVSSVYASLAEPDIFSPLFTPFNTLNHHRDLPPLYYQACGLDTWRDSAILYTHMVREAGSPVKLDIYPGLPHTFWAFYPQVSATKKWVRDLVNGVRWLLEKGKSRATAPRL